MYTRFFTINGLMHWDAIADAQDLQKRIVATMDKREREIFEKNRRALSKPGGFIVLPYYVLVRTP